jgi:hypothetical protein
MAWEIKSKNGMISSKIIEDDAHAFYGPTPAM